MQDTHNAQQRPRTSLIGGYCNHKLIAPMLFEGTCNTLLFNDWLEQMLLPDLWVGSLIVMDNATFHKSQKTIDLIWEAGCTPLFLSPYSPDLNPIEQVFAKLKHLLRKAKERTIDATWKRIGELLKDFTSNECKNYFINAGWTGLMS